MKPFVFTAFLLGIPGIACALFWADAARDARQAAAVLRQARSVTDAKLAQLTARIGVAVKERDDVRNKLEAARSPGAEPPPKRHSAWKAPDTLAVERDDPRMQLLQAAAQRSRTQARYAPLYRRLCLTPAQIEKFENALAVRNERTSDMWAALREQGLPLDGPEARMANTPIYQDYVAAQTSVLGEEGFKQLQDYESTLEVRNVAAALAGAAATRGAPLTGDQAEQLARTLAACSPVYAAGRGGALPKDVEWDKAAMLCQSFLTPAQQEIVMNLAANGPDGVVGRRLSELHAAIELAAQSKQPAGDSK
jgi:hypothetical protein